MTDIFQEVEEDLRTQTFQRLWKKYGAFVIAAAVLAVLAVAGNVGWSQYRIYEAKRQSELYQKVAESFETGGRDAATRAEAFTTVSADLRGGYKQIARMEAAAGLVAAEKWAEAQQAYEAIAADAAVDRNLRDLAAVKAAALIADTASLSDMQGRLDKFAKPDQPMRFTAGELLGYAAYRAGSYELAESYLAPIAADSAAPGDLAARIADLLAMTRAKLPPKPAPAALTPPATVTAPPDAPATTEPPAPPQSSEPK